MGTMEFSRVLLVLFVFLMTWKETMNQQIQQNNSLQHRSKRYHESDHEDYLTRDKQVKIKREKKNIRTEALNPNVGPQARGRPLNLSLGKKASTKTYIPSRKIVKIKPVHRNTKNIASDHKPYVLFVPNHDSVKKIDDQSKANEPAINETSEVTVEEKEQVFDEVIDTETIDKKLSPNIDKNLEKPESQIMKPKTKSKSSKKHSKTRKPCSGKSDEDINITEVKQVSEKHLKIDKSTITPNIEVDISLEKEQDKIKDEIEKETDEKVTVNVTIEKDPATKAVKNEDIVKSLKEEVINLKKHPLLEVIQNDLHISCPIDSKTNGDEVNASLNDDNIDAIKKSAFDLGSIQTLSQNTENNDQNEGVIIKNRNYEEVMEINRTPNDPASYNFNTAQENIAPVSYDNHYQVPSDIYKVPQAEFNLNKNYNQYDPLAPNEQRIDQIDGTTVVSYNNFYKMPTAYSNSNYNGNYYNPSNNRNYGYVPATPFQKVSNIWNNNRGYEKQNTGDTKDRIWRSWKDTEYYLKSKNALNQLSNEQFHNLVNQNSRADKIKYIQRRNSVDVNGYYGKQNISPYL